MLDIILSKLFKSTEIKVEESTCTNCISPIILKNSNDKEYPEYLIGKVPYNSTTKQIEPYIILRGIESSKELSNYLQEVAASWFPETTYIQIHTTECPDSDMWIPVSIEDPCRIEYLPENASLQDIIEKLNQIIKSIRILNER